MKRRRALIWAYIKKRWFKIVIHTFIFSPLALAVWWISFLGPGDARFLSPLGKNNEIIYTCNAITFVFILASFVVVLLSLIAYSIEMLQELWYAPAPTSWGKAFNVTAILAIGVAAIGLIVLITVSILAVSDYLPGDQFGLQQLIKWSRWFAIGTFGLFLLVDSCFVASQSIQRRKILETRVKGWQDKAAKKQLSIDLSWLSIFLINLPMLTVAGLAEWLNRQLESNPILQEYIDMTFNKPLTLPSVSEDIYHLFTNGLDAGIVSATIILSQLVFAVLQIRWDYEEFKLDSGPIK